MRGAFISLLFLAFAPLGFRAQAPAPTLRLAPVDREQTWPLRLVLSPAGPPTAWVVSGAHGTYGMEVGSFNYRSGEILPMSLSDEWVRLLIHRPGCRYEVVEARQQKGGIELAIPCRPIRRIALELSFEMPMRADHPAEDPCVEIAHQGPEMNVLGYADGITHPAPLAKICGLGKRPATLLVNDYCADPVDAGGCRYFRLETRLHGDGWDAYRLQPEAIDMSPGASRRVHLRIVHTASVVLSGPESLGSCRTTIVAISKFSVQHFPLSRKTPEAVPPGHLRIARCGVDLDDSDDLPGCPIELLPGETLTVREEPNGSLSWNEPAASSAPASLRTCRPRDAH